MLWLSFGLFAQPFLRQCVFNVVTAHSLFEEQLNLTFTPWLCPLPFIFMTTNFRNPFQQHSKAMFLWQLAVASVCIKFVFIPAWKSLPDNQKYNHYYHCYDTLPFFQEIMSRMTPGRRVDSLEQLVHSTLAELVTIANEAGVPTGGKAWMWKFHWKYVSNRKTPWAFYSSLNVQWKMNYRSKHMLVCCHSCEQWGSKSKWEQARKGKSGVGDQDVSGVGQDAAPSWVDS